MNAPIHPRSVALAFLTTGLLATTACQPASTSRFGPSSQATLVADTRESAGGRTHPALEGIGQPEGVARARGRFFYVRNGAGTLLTSRQSFVQGLTYDGRGRVLLADGTSVLLTDGELITFAGDRLPLPPATRLPR